MDEKGATAMLNALERNRKISLRYIVCLYIYIL